jgi:hypothetical protein
VVHTLHELDAYPWCGHKALIGKTSAPWQDCDSVLLYFNREGRAAKAAYRRFLYQGVSQGHRPELTGGGLLRSAEGVREVLDRRKKNDRLLTDERILGAGEFVRKVLEKAGGKREFLSPLERIERMELIIEERCRMEGISVEALAGGSRAGAISRIRSELACQFVTELGVCYAEIARYLGVSTPRVSKIISRMQSKLHK